MPKSVELSKARLHFSFGSHMAEDLDKLPLIQQEAASFFAPPPARNIYLREDLGASFSFYRLVDKFYKENGSYIDAYIQADVFSTYKVKFDPDELEFQKGFSLATSLVNTGNPARDQALYTGIFNRHEMVMLDDLKNQLNSEGKTFEMTSEQTPDTEAKRLKQKFMDENNLTQKSMNLLQNGKVDDSAKIFEDVIKARIASSAQRNRTYVGKISDLIRSARKQKQDINIYSRIGFVHQPLIDQLTVVPGYFNSQIEITSSRDADVELLPADKIMLEKEQNPKLVVEPDEYLIAMYATVLESYWMTNSTFSRAERFAKITDVISRSTATDIKSHLKDMTPATFTKKLDTFAS